MPPPDKIRELVRVDCSDPDCPFHTTQEWEAFRHEDETGHRVDYSAWSGSRWSPGR